jgi:hypothetical protein
MPEQAKLKLADIHPDLDPHPGQRLVLSDPARFKIVAAGRRWGKTQLALMEILVRVFSSPPKSLFWIVSPTFSQQEELWQKTLHFFLPAAHPAFKTAKNPDGKLVTKVYHGMGYRRVTFFNDSILFFKSGYQPDTLRGGGERLVYVVFDEAAYLSDYAWRVVRLSLMDQLGQALFISTPNADHPLNWFYDLFLMGQERVETACPECGGVGCPVCNDGIVEVPNPHYRPGYKSFRFSSYDNPHIPKEEVDAIADENPSYDFIQREIYAQFVESSGAVFTLEIINACEKGEFLPPQKGVHYVMGVDLGQLRDFTVACVINTQTNHVDHMERFQGSWDYQFDRLAKIYFDYHEPTTYVDAAQVQGSVIEAELRKRGMTNIVGVRINGDTKRRMIEALRLAIERQELTFPPDRELRAELLAYTAKRLPTGHVRYAGPKSGFDDMVDALALAWEAARSTRGVRTWRPRPWILGGEFERARK